jgi:MFS-type transporter involved in bile tolerance (Atg22 family)
LSFWFYWLFPGSPLLPLLELLVLLLLAAACSSLSCCCCNSFLLLCDHGVDAKKTGVVVGLDECEGVVVCELAVLAVLAVLEEEQTFGDECKSGNGL